jgi:hypothetical protein
MTQRPFLVTADHECIPLEGPFRIEQVRGEWFVLGEHRVYPCAGESAARIRLEQLVAGDDAHALAEQALEGLPFDYDVVAQTR